VLHENGFVHCDLKPDNIMFGSDEYDYAVLYLIDFGLSHSYIDDFTKKHISKPKTPTFKGSLSYCSLNVLNKKCKILLI